MRDGMKATNLDVSLLKWFQDKRGLITAKVAYESVAWVRNAVDKVSDAVALNPFGVYVNGERVADEANYREVEALADCDLLTMLNAMAGDLMLYGYTHYGLDGVKGYERVKRFAPIYVTYERDTGGKIYRIVYRRGTYIRTSAPWQGLDDGGLPYVWLINRHGDEGPGAAPVIAALKSADMLDSMAEYGRRFFDAGGSGPVLVEMPNFATATDAEREKVKSWFDRMVNRGKRAFDALPTGQSVKIHKLGSSPKDIDMSNISPEKREEIAAAFKVPPSLMFANAANFATAQIDKLNFHDYAVNPLVDLLLGQLNERWFSLYGVELRAEPERLQVYQAQELERSEKLLGLYMGGLLTKNEVREETGRVPIDDVRENERDEMRPSPLTEQDEMRPSPPTPLPQGEMGEEQDEELKKWRMKAVKRWKEGKPERGREFESDTIPQAMKAAILAQMDVARTVEDVEAIFDGAIH